MTLQVSPQTKRVFHLSLPIFAELLLQLLVGNMDQFMISHFGSAAVAAIGNGNQVMNVVIIVLTTMSTAATILLTQHIGAGRVGEECSEIVTVAVTVSAVFSFLVGLFLLLEPELVFQLLRTPEDAFDGACLYTRIVGGTVLLQGLYIQLCAVLRSYTLLKEVVVLSVSMNLLNVVGNAILINGFFGFPQMGVAGAAVSTVISKAVGLTLACITLKRKCTVRFSLQYLHPFPAKTFRALLGIALPSGTEALSYNVSQTFILRFINLMGAAVVSAKVYGSMLANVAGTKDAVYEAEAGQKIADDMGYPVMIKASAGGGGKGMRVCYDSEDFVHTFETAKLEAENAFGDGTMYIEKYIEDPRHIEFQILADKYGNTIHLGERDCSIQRRHQKLIEESPSPAISDEQRKKMGEIAVKAAKAAEYYSAGTIEFLRDKHGDFYFIEMNTRIQVEHPVTEWVTGIDLIREQIRIAAGKHLTYTQEDVHVHGHAIEVRINAEDTEHDFRPSPGTVTNVHFPGGKGVRIDSALFAGYQIPPYYDSMIAKLIVYDKNRKLALRKLRNALGELVLEGVKTNIDYQYEIINDEDFIEGNVDTGFIERFQKKHQSENEAE